MKRWIVLAALPIVAGLLDAPPGHAQSAAKRPEFEVASIKPDPGCDPRKDRGRISPGRASFVCLSLRTAIELAYADFDGPHWRWPRPEVLGGPRWVDSDYYDISAKADGPAPYWQMASLMLQALLEERFNVRVHTEDRDTSVYILTVVKNDPRLRRTVEGSGTPADMDNPQAMPAPAPAAPITNERDLRALLESRPKRCGSGMFSFNGQDVIADWHGLDMAGFAYSGLSGRVGRHVVDKTGLTGLYDIHLEFSNDFMRAGASPDAPAAVPTKPSIFAALQQQLGLKLTAGRAPVEFIVIDHAERPSEN